VLDDVSLAIRAGEVVAVLGPSGCGRARCCGRWWAASNQLRHVLAHGKPLVGIHPGNLHRLPEFRLYPGSREPERWKWR